MTPLGGLVHSLAGFPEGARPLCGGIGRSVGVSTLSSMPNRWRNYRRERLACAGKPSFFCDRVVIKYGQTCYQMDTLPPKAEGFPLKAAVGPIARYWGRD